MGVRLKRHPEYGLTLEIFRGVITPECLFQRLGSLREGDFAHWLGYFDPTVDLSLVDIVTLTDLKRATLARMKELNVDQGLIAFVCGPGPIEQTVEFWCRYLRTGSEYRTSTALFASLNAACKWMALPEAACEALTEDVDAEAQEGRDVEAAPEGGPTEQQL